MTHAEYVKKMIEEIKERLINTTYYGNPYVMENWQEASDATIITKSRLEEILESDITNIGYFGEEDGTDGGVIERVAKQFDKLLPEDNDFDMRDYPSFWIDNEETHYYVLFIEDWPEGNLR